MTLISGSSDVPNVQKILEQLVQKSKLKENLVLYTNPSSSTTIQKKAGSAVTPSSPPLLLELSTFGFSSYQGSSDPTAKPQEESPSPNVLRVVGLSFNARNKNNDLRLHSPPHHNSVVLDKSMNPFFRLLISESYENIHVHPTGIGQSSSVSAMMSLTNSIKLLPYLF